MIPNAVRWYTGEANEDDEDEDDEDYDDDDVGDDDEDDEDDDDDDEVSSTQCTAPLTVHTLDLTTKVKVGVSIDHIDFVSESFGHSTLCEKCLSFMTAPHRACTTSMQDAVNGKITSLYPRLLFLVCS